MAVKDCDEHDEETDCRVGMDQHDDVVSISSCNCKGQLVCPRFEYQARTEVETEQGTQRGFCKLLLF